MAIYSFKHGLGDILRILFYSKKCPDCNQKAKRKKVKKEYVETSKSMNEYNFGQSYEVIIYYFCENCKKRIEVSDLRIGLKYNKGKNKRLFVKQ